MKKLNVAVMAVGAMVMLASGVGLGTLMRPAAVEKTPQSCIDALDKTRDFIAVLNQLPDLSKEAMMATYAEDASRLNANTTKVNDLAAEIDALTPGIRTSVAACRAAK